MFEFKMRIIVNKLSVSRRISIILAFAALSSLPSCSVAMAARKSGTSVNDVQLANTRGQILSLGAKVISTEKDDKGNIVETYLVQKEKGSIARAFMHGILDISTCGVWEVVGTPIEGTMYKPEYFTVKISYDESGSVLRKELI